MGVTDQPREQPRQPEERTTIETRTRKTKTETRIQVRMGSRAVQHFHRRNPSQHRVLASIIDDMNKEAGMKTMHKSGARITNVPIDIEPMEVEQENLEEESRRMRRPEKRVTWSRILLQVRSISPRQKSPRTPKMADARTSRMSEAVNTLRGGSQLSQEGAKDCGHFLCQRVGGVCLQEGGEQQGGGGGLRPGFQASNTGHQAANTDYHKLPCSPQMQTVVWRSIPS